MVKKLLVLLFFSFLVLATVVIIRTYISTENSTKATPIALFELPDSAILHLQNAIKIKTVSFSDTIPTDTAAFTHLYLFLKENYPTVFNRLEVKRMNQSLLIKWNGRDLQLKPILLLGHLDVVPATDSSFWETPPFSGLIKDSFIYGRGALDDKIAVINILEAAEKLLKENFTPERTLYFAFGHDEEIGGKKGAMQMANYLASQNIQVEMVLDEGLAVTRGIVQGLRKDAALIGVAEKGYASVRLSLQMHGGHSSTPSDSNVIGQLSDAIAKLEKNQMKPRITTVFSEMNKAMSSDMPFLNKMALRNLWLFKPLVFNEMSKSSTLNAAIRTTTAPTIFKTGIKDNVMPEKGYAVVNFRILPGDSVENVMQHVRDVIDNDKIKLELLEGYNNPIEVSDFHHAQEYQKLSKTIKAIFPDAIVAPGLVLGTTDSRHYAKLSTQIYRFSPIVFQEEDLKRVHGSNERIHIADFKRGINFYFLFMKNLTSTAVEN